MNKETRYKEIKMSTINRRNFIAASAASAASATAVVLGKDVNGDKMAELISSEELAKNLASCPEKQLNIAYGVGNENVQVFQINSCRKGTRYAVGCTIHQTDEYSHESSYPMWESDLSKRACTITSHTKNTSVLDLNHPNLITISAWKNLINSEKRIKYLRRNEGWEVISPDCRLLVIGSNHMGYI